MMIDFIKALSFILLLQAAGCGIGHDRAHDSTRDASSLDGLSEAEVTEIVTELANNQEWRELVLLYIETKDYYALRIIQEVLEDARDPICDYLWDNRGSFKDADMELGVAQVLIQRLDRRGLVLLKNVALRSEDEKESARMHGSDAEATLAIKRYLGVETYIRNLLERTFDTADDFAVWLENNKDALFIVKTPDGNVQVWVSQEGN